MKICDLHTHSNYSDGTLTPTELLNLAVSEGISAIALCDHNTIDGLIEFKNAAKGKAIDAVLGAEITTEYEGIELHILGLFIPEEHFLNVSKYCEKLNRLKRIANKEMVDNLINAGYKIDYERMVSQTARGQINRAHVASELVRNGYAQNISDAFERLLTDGGRFYKSPQRFDAIKTITFLKEIGAVPVIAHPFYSAQPESLESFWQKAKEAGLVGMEALYPMYDESTTKTAIETAEKYGFLQSGGSDFHGANKPHIAIGKGKGSLSVPYEFFEKLKKHSKTCK